jgi:hypothetical protein
VLSATEAASDQPQLTAKTSKVSEVIFMLWKKGDDAALSAVMCESFAIEIMRDHEREIKYAGCVGFSLLSRFPRNLASVSR